MRINPSLASDVRRKQLEKELNISLPEIGAVRFDKDEKPGCENMIGGTAIPLGVAGPLVMLTGTGKSQYVVPLATTEGALVASVNRGCKAVAEAGGAVVRCERVGTTRAPVFETGSLEASLKLEKWVRNHTELLQKEAEKTSSHLELIKADIKVTGPYVFVRFYFETGDAMGMNMATIASDRLVAVIHKKNLGRCIALSGNYCVDKKPSYLNFITGRGLSGWADIVLPERTLRTVLKTTAAAIFDVWIAKSVMGSVSSGTIGNNAHFANIVAAFYAATGQDLAHVVEGSMGITTAKVVSGNSLYFSVYLPSIMAGTVGGGTKLRIKKEALSILRVSGAQALAEVLTGAVLAGEISLLASLAEGTLAAAHARLGR